MKPTQKLAFAVIVGIGGLSLLYLFVWVLSIFNWGLLYCDQFRTVGIVVTVIAVVLAALSLTLDFGSSRRCVDARRAEVHGVVRRLRPHGHAHLAVHHAAATARPPRPQPVGETHRSGALCAMRDPRRS